jgi:tRNA A-37 threonylcarbamoyl transferase component Bud32
MKSSRVEPLGGESLGSESLGSEPLGGAGGPNPSIANTGAVQNRILRGIGSYGAVVSPAIDNIIRGEIHTFPNKVTKLLFRKNAYNKTLHNMRVIKERIPELAYNIDTYERNIRLEDIRNEAIREQILRHFQKKKIDVTDATLLYGVRMNDMGYDLFEIYSNEALQQYLLTHVSFKEIVVNMKKVAETVQAILTTGLIHGDIRDVNILCNVNTGELQVIDFDFLHPIGRPELEYYRMRYSYPIESYIINNTDDLLTYIKETSIQPYIFKDTIITGIHKRVVDHITAHYDTVIALFAFFKIMDKDELITMLVKGYTNAIIKLINTIRESPVERRSAECEIILKDTYNKTCDSYGLGIAFIHYISGIQQRVKNIPILNQKLSTLWNIALNMVYSNFMGRMVISGPIDYIGRLIDEISDPDNADNALLLVPIPAEALVPLPAEAEAEAKAEAPASAPANPVSNNNYMGVYKKLTRKQLKQSKKLTRNKYRKYKSSVKKTHRTTHKSRSKLLRKSRKLKYSKRRALIQ